MLREEERALAGVKRRSREEVSLVVSYAGRREEESNPYSI
jgi:hypothetical protein